MEAAPNDGQSDLRASVWGLRGLAGSGPVVLRLGLGLELRRLREAAERTRDDAAHLLRCSTAKISRMENGRLSSIQRRDVEDLLTLYGIHDAAERAALVDVAENASKPAWWHTYSDVLPTWFETYLGLEEAAQVIRSYEMTYVPGLLQTRDYARAVTQLAVFQNLGEVERRVQLRMRRQELLTRPDPPTLWAIIDEAALRRHVGGYEVARAQIRHLMEVCQRPNISLQIAPLSYGRNPAAATSFTLMRFPHHDIPDIVYQEHLAGALYFDKVADVDLHRAVINQLSINIRPPNEAVAILSRIHNTL